MERQVLPETDQGRATPNIPEVEFYRKKEEGNKRLARSQYTDKDRIELASELVDHIKNTRRIKVFGYHNPHKRRHVANTVLSIAKRLRLEVRAAGSVRKSWNTKKHDESRTRFEEYVAGKLRRERLLSNLDVEVNMSYKPDEAQLEAEHPESIRTKTLRSKRVSTANILD